MFLNIHRFLSVTKAEGPGKRACLWVQGCPIRCIGCAVPETWDENGGQKVSVEELAERILNGPDVEGVTFLGGEPFAQAKPLAALGRLMKNAGLSVVTFTGYVLEEIQKSTTKEWHELVSVSDLLIDGPYRRELADFSRPWVGSFNKRFHFLTPRYQALKTEIMAMPNRLEIRFTPNGLVLVNGMASSTILDELFDYSLVRE
ncbi:MAG: radical SAM protein [Nitrospira sp.]|nr:radical SAM protein [Nitrospira sp.]